MNQRMFKQLGILLSFLLVFAQMSFAQPLATQAAVLEQAVTITAIDIDGESVIETEAVEFEKGDTAWDVLDEVAGDLNYEESEYGKMLQGINGVIPDFDNNGAYWAFIVNGEAASVGLDSYEVEHGDNILAAVTDNSSKDMKVNVSATNDSEEYVVEKTEVTLAPHATAYDAIVQATEDIDVSVDDQFFTFINNINQYDMEENDFWEINSNNEALDVGGLSYQVQPGEHIQLKLQTFDSGSNQDQEEDEKVSEDESTEDEVNDTTNEESSNNESDSDDTEDNDSDLSEKGTSESVEINNISKKDLKKINKDIDVLTQKVLNGNLATEYGDEWWVWGLGVAGEQAPSSYKQNIEKTIKETKGDLGQVTELEKVIIALSSQGYDATDVAGYNLIEMLESHPELENPVVNSAIYALIAFNSGDYEVDAEIENKILQSVLDAELENGGWAFFGNDISPDITGMSLIALANYKDDENVKEKIDRAVDALSKEQHDNGGFYEAFNGGYSSEAASQAIIGLISVGVDPTGELFTKKDANLVEYLLEFRTENGYLHVLEDEEPGPFPDQQALLALGFINNHIEKQDTGKEEETPDKDKDKDKDSNKDQSKVTVKQNTKTPVNAKQTVKVKDTKVSIKMPKDLPNDAQIKVTVLDKVDSGKLKVAGDIVEIDVIDANGKPIKGDFILTLEIEESLIGEDVSIYYFDEKTNTWKHVGGTVNDDGTISVKVNQFSKYGVFLTAESDKEKGATNEGTNGISEDDENPETAVTVDDNNDDGTVQADEASKQLPATATNIFNVIVIGLFIGLLGAALLFVQRKRTKQS